MFFVRLVGGRERGRAVLFDWCFGAGGGNGERVRRGVVKIGVGGRRSEAYMPNKSRLRAAPTSATK